MNKFKLSAMILSMLVLFSPISAYSYERKTDMNKTNVCLSTTKTNEANKTTTQISFPAKISEVFPDADLAQTVAGKLNKNVNDLVTEKELAGITGEFSCHPGDMSNLTGIGYLTGITSLNCCKNNVSIIPTEIGKLTNLEVLNFSKAFNVKNIPPEIGKLTKLKYMYFYMNSFNSVPKEIGNLVNLKILSISCNSPHSIPTEIGNLKKLEVLDLHLSNLTSLPESISNLTNLRYLDISHNTLTKLPKNIGNLKKLKVLNLFNNKLTSIPSSIGNMIELTDLNIYDNYKLSEGYKKYLPKIHDIKLSTSLSKSCAITLPFSNIPKNSKITYDFKPEDEGSDFCGKYYDYVNIKLKISKGNKITLSSNLFKKKGSYVFRIVVKTENKIPEFNIYKWNIVVK